MRSVSSIVSDVRLVAKGSMRFALRYSLFLVGLCLMASPSMADAPQVFWASDPVLPNDTVLAMGEGMGGVTGARLTRLPDTPPTGAMTTGVASGAVWQTVRPLQVTPNAAKFIVPPAWKAGAFACRLVAGGVTSKTFLVNAPDPWWLQGDGGEGATPGGWLRVFGKSLGFGGVSWALLRDERGKVIVLPAAPNDGFALRFTLPKALTPGNYTVFVHNGTGGDAAWTRGGCAGRASAPGVARAGLQRHGLLRRDCPAGDPEGAGEGQPGHRSHGGNQRGASEG